MTGTETLRPSLAALSTRLGASTAAPAASKSMYVTTSNNDSGYDHREEPATSAPASLRIDEYAALSVNSAGGSELTRRPSVAIGGVRSPNLRNDDTVAYSNNRPNAAPPASVASAITRKESLTQLGTQLQQLNSIQSVIHSIPWINSIH